MCHYAYHKIRLGNEKQKRKWETAWRKQWRDNLNRRPPAAGVPRIKAYLQKINFSMLLFFCEKHHFLSACSGWTHVGSAQTCLTHTGMCASMLCVCVCASPCLSRSAAQRQHVAVSGDDLGPQFAAQAGRGSVRYPFWNRDVLFAWLDRPWMDDRKQRIK